MRGGKAENPVYVDVDGTLTHNGAHPWGVARGEAIKKLIAQIARGEAIVVWSARGTTYVTAFCKHYKIKPMLMIGKPSGIVDDNPHIRTPHRMPCITPADFEEGKWPR